MKFDLPWRIHWKLADRVGEDQVRSIRESGPLAVTLEVRTAAQLAPLGLPWEGVSLCIIHQGWRDADQGPVKGAADRWEFPIVGPGEARELRERSFLGLQPEEVSFRWFPRRGTLGDLLPILETVRDSGCGLTLPNRPAGVITSEGSRAFPEACELSEGAAADLRRVAGELRAGQVRVHDFILTKALGLQGLEPQGCEAANSLAFIDSDGTVFPCETLRVPMGNLDRGRLDAIWSSPVRARIRKDVMALPGICAACPDLPGCRGGCRGAVYHFQGHYGAPDPLCRAGEEGEYE